MTEFAIDPALPPGLPKDPNGTVITVGTFDGVHRGHWAVLQEIRLRAKETGRRSVLVTFHPHPLAVVRPDDAPPLLTTPAEKKEILAETGLDYAVFLHFTHVLAEYSPERFVTEILMGSFGLGNTIREGNVAKIVSLIEGGRGDGMQLMDDSLMKRYREKLISAETAYLYSHQKQKFRHLVESRKPA